MDFYYQNLDLYHNKCLDLATKNCEKHLNLKYSQKNINPQNRWKIWLGGGGVLDALQSKHMLFDFIKKF